MSECETCNGSGEVEREVRMHSMNGSGFEFIPFECPDCKGEGQLEEEEA